MTYLSILTLFLLSLFFASSDATRFTIKNNCPQTVWAAASPGGGRRLDSGQTWDLDVPSNTPRGRIWGRTKCNFDCSCMGPCETGDCGSSLECKGKWGVRWGDPPNTIAEYSLGLIGKYDFYYISLVNGFNLPMEFSPTGGVTSWWCRQLFCTANIVEECPDPLRVPGGCNNPCTIFKTQEYCCTNGPCGPTDYSRFFKERCSNAYSYPVDDPNPTFNCPAGTNFSVTFCPMGNYGNKNETFVNVE